MADFSQLPQAPDDALISGRTWNLLRRFGQSNAPEIGTADQPESPRGVEMLMIVVDEGPNGEPSPADNTYWLKNVDIIGAESEEERLEVSERDDEDESLFWILATNVAEQVAGSHTVPVGTPVLAKMFRDPNGLRRWEFSSATGGGEQTYPARIEGTCDAMGGLYKVTVYGGTTTLSTAGCLLPVGTDPFPLNLPAGLTIPSQWVDPIDGAIEMLAVHTKENGLMTHWLKVGAWTVGTIRMSTNGFPVFFIQDAYARAIGGPLIDSGNVSLGGTSTGATDSWLRDFIDNQAGDANQKGDSPVQITRPTRVSYNPGSAGNCQAFPPSLDFGLRTDQYDAQGHLAGIGSETQFSIPGCCPPSLSLASASFATEAQATYARAISASIAASNTLG